MNHISAVSQKIDQVTDRLDKKIDGVEERLTKRMMLRSVLLRRSMPFIVMMLATVAVLYFWPGLALYLPFAF